MTASGTIGTFPVPDGLAPRHRMAAIAAISLGTMVTSLDNGSVSLALPTLTRDLHIRPADAVMIITIYQLVLIMAVLPFSAVGDRVGHRRLYQGGLALFMSATVGCLVCRTLPELLIVRALQSLGAAATFSVSAALVRAIYPRARLGSGLALNTVVASTSASLAPTLGGLILSLANWHWLFAATVPLAGASLLAGRRALPSPPTTGAPFDLWGSLLCAAMFGTAVGGLECAAHGLSLGLYGPIIASCAVFAFAFIRKEWSKSDPILPIDILGQRLVAFASSGALLANLAATTLQLTLPFRLQQAYGYTPGQVGLLLASWPVAMMIVAPASGILSDRLPPALLCMIGMVAAGLGMLALALLPPAHSGQIDLIWRIALTATGFGLFYSPNARQLIAAVPAKRTAPAGALAQTTRMAGQVLGSTVTAALLALNIGLGAVAPLVGVLLATAVLLFSAAAFRETQGQRRAA